MRRLVKPGEVSVNEHWCYRIAGVEQHGTVVSEERMIGPVLFWGLWGAIEWCWRHGKHRCAPELSRRVGHPRWLVEPRLPFRLRQTEVQMVATTMLASPDLAVDRPPDRTQQSNYRNTQPAQAPSLVPRPLPGGRNLTVGSMRTR